MDTETESMLKKCANPNCPTIFKYLREGRLFRLAVDTTEQTTESAPKRVLRVERFWLCGACSSRFTLISDGQKSVTLAPLTKNQNRKDKCIQILDLTGQAQEVHIDSH